MDKQTIHHKKIGVQMLRIIGLLSFLIAMGVFGCQSIPVSWNNEPTIIIIRNSSNEYLEQVSIKEDRERERGGIHVQRISISPVPIGISQSVGRPTHPSKFPSQIKICWTNIDNKEFCKQVSIKKVLKEASEIPGEALVFEILPFSEINVFLERS
jgi:hypothetical protein